MPWAEGFVFRIPPGPSQPRRPRFCMFRSPPYSARVRRGGHWPPEPPPQRLGSPSGGAGAACAPCPASYCGVCRARSILDSIKIYGIATPVCALVRNDASILGRRRRPPLRMGRKCNRKNCPGFDPKPGRLLLFAGAEMERRLFAAQQAADVRPVHHKHEQAREHSEGDEHGFLREKRRSRREDDGAGH